MEIEGGGSREMKQWRPKDWNSETIAKENVPSFKWGSREYGEIIRGIDIGADAMLEALRGEYSSFRPETNPDKEIKSNYGAWVFIPDGEAKV